MISRSSRPSSVLFRYSAALCGVLMGLAGCGDEASTEPSGSSDMDTQGDATTEDDSAVDEAVELDVANDPDVPDLVDAPDLVDDPGRTHCHPATDSNPEMQTLSVGDWTVDVWPTTGAWRVTPKNGDTAVLSGPGACVSTESDGAIPGLRVATGVPYVRNGFGAFQIELETSRSELDWYEVSVASARVDELEGGVALVWSPAPALAVANGVTEIRLSFMLTERGDLEVSFETDGESVLGGELRFDCGASESFFGLGTQVTGMDLRGRTYPLWTQEQGNGKPENGGAFPLQNIPEAAYAPMGIWHSSAGYSALLTHDAYSEIDLCEADASAVRLRSYGALPGFVLARGDTPRGRLSALTEYIGRLVEVPDWVYGPWHDAVGGPERIEVVASVLRDNDIPASAIWTEDWIGGGQSAFGYRLSYAWEWDPTRYPNLDDDIAALHTDGFAFLAYFNTFVPEPTRMYGEGVEGGYLVMKRDDAVYRFQDPAFRWAGLVDLSNAEARDWMASYMLRAAVDLGIDGWMADFSEWLQTDAVLASGESAWTYHNRYPLEFQRLTSEALTEAHADEEGAGRFNWAYFVRSGWASVNGGTGGVAPLMWGGDQNTNWAYDDGYPTVIPIATHVGLSGVAIFGSDIAGYNALGGVVTSKELFYRWSQVGAFTPLMRTHHGSDECANWAFDRDDETMAHYRRYASIHTRMFPLFKQLEAEARATGLPMVRHPYLVAPDATGFWNTDQYAFFLGDDLLVAPVLIEGATDRTVYLPADGWYPLFADTPLPAGAAVEGGVEIAAVAPVTELPVYVRPGTALPLLPEVVDSFYGAASAQVTDLSDVAGRFAVALYPAADGGVRETVVGAGTLSGAGWSAEIDWSLARVGEVGFALCAEPTSTNCFTEVGVRVSGGVIALSVDGATLTIASDVSQDYFIGFGPAVWGDLADATQLLDLTPDIPPPCHEE